MADYTGEKQPWANVSISDIFIEEGVTTIGRNAFNGVGNGTVGFIDFPESSLKEIKAGAFANLPLVDQIKIPKSVETIGDGAFQNCNNLSKVFFFNRIE